MLNRKKFFAGIRSGPFNGKLKPETVRAIVPILDEYEMRNSSGTIALDLRDLAYILATNLRECGENMLPVREGFKTSDMAARAYIIRQKYKYGKIVNGEMYYGRGRVQITWDYNYKKMGEFLGLDLYNNPDWALDDKISVQIMFEGMIRGMFTGKKLADYFNDKKTDWHNARRIVNGTDHAAEIATNAKLFYADLVEASK